MRTCVMRTCVIDTVNCKGVVFMRTLALAAQMRPAQVDALFDVSQQHVLDSLDAREVYGMLTA